MRCQFLLALLAATPSARADDSGTDPAHKYAWGENIGWANAAPTNQAVTVHFDGATGWLSGRVWGENIGWITLGAAAGGPYANTTPGNWGVNLSARGALAGYAWGENVGWINFGPALGAAAINLADGVFSGQVWGENVGWLKLRGAAPDYGVATRAFATQPQGTPNWWLDHHGVAEGFDVGDGVPAWQKYVMDTDPRVVGDYLRIAAVSNAPATHAVAFAPASTRRYYTLVRTADPSSALWSPVTGPAGVAGTGGQQTLQDTNAEARASYAVKVSLVP